MKSTKKQNSKWGRGNNHRNKTRNLGEQQRGDPGHQLWSRPGEQPGWRQQECGGLSDGSDQEGWGIEIILSFWDVENYTERLLEGVGTVKDSYKAKQADITTNHKHSNIIQ